MAGICAWNVGFDPSEIASENFGYFGRAQAQENGGKEQLLAFLMGAIKRGLLQPFTLLKRLSDDLRKDLLNTKDVYGADLLTIACVCSRKDIVECLIDELQADVQAPLNSGRKLRLLGSYYAREDANFVEIILNNGLLELLMRKGAKLGATFLVEACMLDNSEHLERLLKLGADPEETDEQGCSLLHTVIKNRRVKVAKWLVESAKVDVNKVSTQGESPLHLAVKANDTETIRLLLDNGATLLRDDDFLTPPMLAAANRMSEAANLFLNYSLKNGDLLSACEKADLLELLGCSYFAVSESETHQRTSVSLWLRAERLRKSACVHTPDYESSCAALVNALSKVVPDLLPIQLLGVAKLKGEFEVHQRIYKIRDDEDDDDDDAIIDHYLRPQNALKATAHFFVRKARLDSVCALELLRFAKNFLAHENWHHLVRFALAATLECKCSKAKQRDACFRIISFTQSLNDMLQHQATVLDPASLVGFVELFADYLHEFPNNHCERESESESANHLAIGKVCVSVLLGSVSYFFLVVLRAIARFGFVEGLVERFERAVRRVCARQLRGARGYTLLHFAALSCAARDELFEDLQKFAWRGQSGACHFSKYPVNVCSRSVSCDLLPDAGVIELLIRAGADCNARDDDGNTALHLIAYEAVSLQEHLLMQALSARRSLKQLEIDVQECIGPDGVELRSKVRLTLARRSLQSVLDRTVGTGHADADVSDQLLFATLLSAGRDDGKHRVWFYYYVLLVAACRTLLPFVHWDVRNEHGKVYWEVLHEDASLVSLPNSLISQMVDTEVASLQCLCARRIRSLRLDFKTRLPAKTAEFVALH